MKPEKKEVYGSWHEHFPTILNCTTCEKNKVYNQAIDDYDKHLPSEVEIKEIIQLRYFKLFFPNVSEPRAQIVAEVLAKAIHKRINE